MFKLITYLFMIPTDIFISIKHIWDLLYKTLQKWQCAGARFRIYDGSLYEHLYC